MDELETLREYDPRDIARAIVFYEQSPDGQFDDVAALALRVVLRLLAPIED